MSRPLLPPRGIEMPTDLLFDRTVRDAIKITWLQLRAMAWGKIETPPFSAQQFLDLTGTKPGTLYEHMRILRDRHALQWRSGTASTFIVSFAISEQEPDILKIQNYENSEHAITPTVDIDHSITKRVAHSENSESRKSRKLDADKPLTAVEVYRRIVERYPKKALCQEIERRVGAEPDNIAFWGRVVTAYYGMGWNPVNIFGMLDYYERREVPAPKAQPQHGNKITPQQPGVIPAVNKAVVAAINARNAARRSGGGGAVSVPAQPVTAAQRPASDT